MGKGDQNIKQATNVITTGGYTCGACGAFVPNYTSHYCVAEPVTTTPPQPQIWFYPCSGTNHDFVLGPTHAICNRCEKVVKIDG